MKKPSENGSSGWPSVGSGVPDIFSLVNMDVHPPNAWKIVATHPQIRTHPDAEPVFRAARSSPQASWQTNIKNPRTIVIFLPEIGFEP